MSEWIEAKKKLPDQGSMKVLEKRDLKDLFPHSSVLLNQVTITDSEVTGEITASDICLQPETRWVSEDTENQSAEKKRIKIVKPADLIEAALQTICVAAYMCFSFEVGGHLVLCSCEVEAYENKNGDQRVVPFDHRARVVIDLRSSLKGFRRNRRDGDEFENQVEKVEADSCTVSVSGIEVLELSRVHLNTQS